MLFASFAKRERVIELGDIEDTFLETLPVGLHPTAQDGIIVENLCSLCEFIPRHRAFFFASVFFRRQLVLRNMHRFPFFIFPDILNMRCF